MVMQPGRGLRVRVTLSGHHVVCARAHVVCVCVCARAPPPAPDPFTHSPLLPTHRESKPTFPSDRPQIGSPVEDLVGLVLPEWCVCPVAIGRWLSHMTCPQVQQQVWRWRWWWWCLNPLLVVVVVVVVVVVLFRCYFYVAVGVRG